MLGEMTLAVLIFMGNLMFMKHLGDDGVAAFGIACYYTPFFFNIGNAVAQSAQPIISYNYGISRWDYVAKARRLLLVTSLLCGMVVMALFLFMPHLLVSLFLNSASTAPHRTRRIPLLRHRHPVLYPKCRHCGLLPEHRAHEGGYDICVLAWNRVAYTSLSFAPFAVGDGRHLAFHAVG